ncbi:response regulator transcription factor [Hyphomicrobium denitrificans]|uniref:response regulator transcription factor n=1 Tax=Hyphomicrobium denitrificans TaxID=53399 RepID=UPI00022E892D|nr:response regulator [Hyphomicrobium denitrificans]
MALTVSLIDDDPSVLDAVSLLLRTQGVTTVCFSCAQDFLAATPDPGCIVSDVRMPEVSGLDLLRQLSVAGDPRPLILLTGHGDVAMAVEAVKLGAFDFIEKPFDNVNLVTVVKDALEAAVATHRDRTELTELRERFQGLSERQRDTMQLLVRGFANKEIGRQLGISPRTVEIHRTLVMNKMGAKTLAELVRKAMALGVG